MCYAGFRDVLQGESSKGPTATLVFLASRQCRLRNLQNLRMPERANPTLTARVTDLYQICARTSAGWRGVTDGWD
jgi:hypothetical protein